MWKDSECAGANQLSIIGGANESLDNSPTRQNMIKAGMTGQLTDNLVSEFAIGWARTRAATNRTNPNQAATLLGIIGTDTNAGNVTLDFGALDEPIDIGAQGASALNEPIDVDAQATDSRNFQINADFNWLKGGHTFQFGSRLRYLPTSFMRDNKEDGSLNSLVAQVGAGGLQIPVSLRPPTCNETTTVNCLQPGDDLKWDRLYASALGLVDNISLLAVRDEHFNVLPAGSQLVTDARLFAPEVYLQDVWRARPSLTLTYGLNYGWQTSPKVKLSRMTILVDGQSLTPQTAQDYLRARDEAARRGEIFNPSLAFQPVNDAKRSVFDTDWNNVSPRASAAWSPSYENGFLGKLFGDRKTVIRGGYSLIYDRQNAVQSVINPTQGVGFGQTLNLTLPLCDATGDGGTNCDPASANVAVNGFRVGVDGTFPLPVVPEQSKPFLPFWGLRPGASTETADPKTDVILFPEAVSFQVDPSIEVAQSHAFDLT